MVVLSVSRILTTDSETVLVSASSQQPVSIAVKTDQSSFRLLKRGVLTTTCSQHYAERSLKWRKVHAGIRAESTFRRDGPNWHAENVASPTSVRLQLQEKARPMIAC